MTFPIYPVFILWSVPWLILSCFLLVALFAAITNDNWGWGISLTLLWTGLFTVFGSGTELSITWGQIAIGAAIYIPIGIAYIFLRWILYVTKQRDIFEKILVKYSTEQGFELVDGKIPSEHRAAFKKWWDEGSHWRFDLNPTSWDHKHSIITWGAWWPISLPVWLFGDVMRELWVFIIRKLTRTLTAISERIWPDVSDNFK